MGYELLDDGTFADVAVKCKAETLEDLFMFNSEAFAAIILDDADAIKKNVEKILQVQAEEPDLLLLDFMNELVYQKDVNNLLFLPVNMKIERQDGILYLVALMKGERIGKKCSFIVDVKAATMHKLSVIQDNEGLSSFMILDV